MFLIFEQTTATWGHRKRRYATRPSKQARMQSTVLLLLLAFLVSAMAMRQQSVAVKGKLVCGSKPASQVRIKLWEEDSGPDPDDLLDSGYTDENGEFFLKGDTRELTNIDPFFKAYHDCDDGIKPGKRKIKFGIPYLYVSSGKDPKKVFDIGVLNLETIFKKEERELIVSKKRRAAHEPYVRHHDDFDLVEDDDF